MLDLDRIPNQERLLRAYKVFFQPPIFDIWIDNPLHKSDRISQPSEYSTNPVLRARKFSIGGLTT
ncbi:hypothetical protein [Cylindrospermopsis raciborskii]|uniref:Uncharacterized protein n=1 Tax=Cylindrospermopsis raciborskii CS-505 TaxID=533240 RepID=A0A853MEL3_9CYAN|nr:hypothetical protein [Cylindrospermopsis raciborskii]EFA68846.1 hypothetical protein CRC_02997 [Cylindrospermopsis raciborskii CS-505]OBU77810.1 hypothetical protein A9P98_17110 [Cylindrospermopsis raciborskii CS-505]